MKHKTKRNSAGFEFHYKIKTQPNFVERFAKVLKVFEINWVHWWLNLANLWSHIEIDFS